jgi:hypothetical protein
MSDNLINLIKSALFPEAVTVATDGGDISPVVIQPAQMTGQDKYNLDQRDSLSVLLFSDLGTITAGATITAKYYARFPNATTDSKLLSTEVITAPAITVGGHYVARFTGENLVNCDADYFTIMVVLKEAVGSAYTVTCQVTVKKKIIEQPLTNQPTPTTSTVGYLGQVVFDTDGNEWKCIKIIGSTYYWALPRDVFPAVNTEYLAYFSGSTAIWKKQFKGVTASGQLSIPHGIENWVEKISISGTLIATGGISVELGGYTSSGSFSSLAMDATNIILSIGTNYNSKAFTIMGYYIKA